MFMEAVSLVCNMPQCSDHDHNVETGDVTRPVMMPHSSCDTDITPETNFLQTKQICRNLPPRRIHKIIPRLFPGIVFIKRRSIVFILRWLFHDHDSPSQIMFIPEDFTTVDHTMQMWESESKIYISACKTCWYNLFLHPLVMKYASKSQGPLSSEQLRPPL